MVIRIIFLICVFFVYFTIALSLANMVDNEAYNKGITLTSKEIKEYGLYILLFPITIWFNEIWKLKR